MGCGASKVVWETQVEKFDAKAEKTASSPQKPPKPRSADTLLRGNGRGKSNLGKRVISSAKAALTRRRRSPSSSSYVAPSNQVIQQKNESANKVEQVPSSFKAINGVKRKEPSFSSANSISVLTDPPSSSSINPVKGHQLPPLFNSGNEPTYSRPKPVDSTYILESLRAEGLLQSSDRGKSGVSYEAVAPPTQLPLDELKPKTANPKQPPERLTTRHSSRQTQRQSNYETDQNSLGDVRNSGKPVLSLEDLKMKLNEAERRRKARVQERLSRMRDRDAHNLHTRLQLLTAERGVALRLQNSQTDDIQLKTERRQRNIELAKERELIRQRKIAEARERRLSMSQSINTTAPNGDNLWDPGQGSPGI